MKPLRRGLALFLLTALLALVLAVGIGRQINRGAPIGSLAPARQLTVLIVPGLSLQDALSLSAARRAAVAVMPTRSARDVVTPEEACFALARGSRQPTPDAQSVGDLLKSNAIALDTTAAALIGGATGESPVPWHIQDDIAPAGWATDAALLARAVENAARQSSHTPVLIAATFDDLYRADLYAPLCLPEAVAVQRRNALRRLEALLSQWTAQLAPDTALLLVTPIPDRQGVTERGERLGPLLLWHKDTAPGLLTSPSTRHTPGLVAPSDIATTLATLLGRSPEQARIGAGRAVVGSNYGRSDTYLEGRAAAWAFQSRAQRLLVGVPWFLAVLLLAGVWVSSPRLQRALLLAATSVPLALLLTPLIVPTRPGFEFALYAVVLLFATLPAASGAHRAAWSRILLLTLCAMTLLTLAADTLLGGPLLSRTPLSYSVQEAARFYGIGNEASGVLLGSAAVLIMVVGASPVSALLLGACCALVLGLPALGADAGGFAVSLLAFGALAVRTVTSGRERKRMLARGAGGLITVLLLLFFYALWDASQSEGSRTHVGQAVAAARARGSGALTEIAIRKISTNARLLVTSPWAVLLLTEVCLCVYFLRRKENTPLPPEESAAFFTLAVAAGTLFLVNDSGVVAAATCLLPAVPLLFFSFSDTAVQPSPTCSAP